MSTLFSRFMTFAGGATFVVAGTLAFMVGSTELPLTLTIAAVGLGVVQIYR
jgi:hypothetical protein